MPEVTVCTYRPLIQCFFTRMTAQQWGMLTTGAPDDATKAMLADLLLDIITCLSKALLQSLRRNNVVVVTEESVKTTLGDTLSQSFAEVLDIEDPCQCVSSERLIRLVNKEVAESVNSALSTCWHTATPVINQRVTPPRTLNVMVGQACKMLKSITAKIKIACKPRRRRPSLAPEDEDELAMLLRDDAAERLETPERCLSDAVSSIPDIIAAQKILSQEVSELIEPLLDSLSDTEFKMLHTESSLDIEVLAEDIARSMAEENIILEEIEAAGPSSETDAKIKQSRKGIGKRLKGFFAKRFAKAWIHHMVQHLKTKFHKDSKLVPSKQSVQSLIKSVDDLLLTEDGEKPQGENEVCVFRKFKNISSGRVLIFTQGLSDLLYGEVTQGMAPEVIPETSRRRDFVRKVHVPEAHTEMYTYIRNKAWGFMGLMSWFLNTQVSSHSERVTQAIMGPEPPSQIEEVVEESAPKPPHKKSRKRSRKTLHNPCIEAVAESSPMPSNEASPEVPPEAIAEEFPMPSTEVSPAVSEPKETPAQSAPDSIAQAEKYKMSIQVFVWRLVNRIFKTAKVSYSTESTEDIFNRLIERIWAEVQGVDFDIRKKTIEKLDAAIFKVLCKKYGCAEIVLVTMMLNDPTFENCIAFAVRDRLVKTKKRSAICRFFSSLGTYIAYICCCGKGSPIHVD